MITNIERWNFTTLTGIKNLELCINTGDEPIDLSYYSDMYNGNQSLVKGIRAIQILFELCTLIWTIGFIYYIRRAKKMCWAPPKTEEEKA